MRRAERLLTLLEATGADRLLRPALAGVGAVFVLHRVARAGEPVLDPDLTTSADLLDAALELTRKEGFDCVHLDEVPARLRGGRRFVAFTFDDGYRDNLTVALPVFRAHKVPLCVYITTAMIDRTLPYWWGALARVVAARSSLDLSGLGIAGNIALDSWESRRAAYLHLEAWVHDDLEQRSVALLDWCAAQGVDWRQALDEDALTWDDLRELARDPLVTIGAHTVSHPRLASLDDASAQRELSDARSRLEHELGRPVRHLAYPYGGPAACSSREFRMAADAGYATAVTTRRGNLFRPHAGRLTALPRRRLTEGAPTMRTVYRGLIGTAWLLRRGPRVVLS